jgi:hypothetical protein
MAEQTDSMYKSYKVFEVGGQSGPDAARNPVSVERTVKVVCYRLRETPRRGRH